MLEHPERYICVEPMELCSSTMNVVLDDRSTDIASDGVFLWLNSKEHQLWRAFVLARFDRAELPEARINFEDAARYL